MSPFEIISWSIVIAFVVVLGITILGMVGLIKFKHEEHLKKLVVLLVFEIVGVGFLIYKEGKDDHAIYLREAQSRYVLAKRMSEENKYDEALRELSGILQLDLQEGVFHVKDVFITRGDILFNRKSYADSIIPYAVYNEIVTNDAQALARYGRALRHVHRYDEAMKIYERALALEPNDYYILNGLQNCIRRQAGFFLEAGRKEAATAYFDEARKHIVSMQNIAQTATENRDRKMLNAELAMARLNWQWERYAEAIALLEEIKRNYPDYSAAQEDLAAIYLEYGRHISNQSYIEKSVVHYEDIYSSLSTDHDKIFIGAGLAEAIANLDNPSGEQVETARNAVLLSIAKNSEVEDDPYPFYAAAILFYKIGELAEAKKYIKEAIFSERRRADNPYTFDYVRLVEYEKLQQKWSPDA